MKKNMLNIFISIFLCSFSLSTFASLLISPTRLVLDERSRSANVILMNTSNEIQSYRLDWKELKALPEGGYRELSQQELLSFPILSRIARLSPKQVTLKPGESQTVKVSARKPRNLNDGEYRSHLQFTALPKVEVNASSPSTTSIKLNVLLSYSIPVIFRLGQFQYGNKINNISLKHDKKNNKATINIELQKQGKYSLSGNLFAYWKPLNSSKETRVGILNGFNFHHELDNIVAKVAWENFTLAAGTLRVVYQGTQEFSGTKLSDYSLTITPAMVKSALN
ncbi:fimbria/pilus periplasmic chaperone [Marinomonas sp. 15G1-11]|uniref:Fimbria/pilus periplasmic chaperone n=1 Tax=Marinomonas phaeophyticola TaxID=3004091 RepID=A0ABT4JR20_9GAMM|nr:fimbria/pilus periplasmic chaperone [Marinomonas sp. 15G1-11]MCZ2720690.1 fimbria/pilus periplasmic chaperone [Marinomonas sp. 15G1-11]